MDPSFTHDETGWPGERFGGTVPSWRTVIPREETPDLENPKDEQLMKPLLVESPHNFKEICPEERDCPGTSSDHLTLVVPSTALIKHRMPAALPRDCRWPAAPYSAKPHAGLGPIGRPYSN